VSSGGKAVSAPRRPAAIAQAGDGEWEEF
jgi:hypothetical protein